MVISSGHYDGKRRFESFFRVIVAPRYFTAISPFTSSSTSNWRRLRPSRLYGMHRAGTTPSVCVHIAAWRRIRRTFQKPYGELYLQSRQLDSFRHLRDAPFWRRCRASGRAVTMGGTGDSLKNVVASSLLSCITPFWRWCCASGRIVMGQWKD